MIKIFKWLQVDKRNSKLQDLSDVENYDGAGSENKYLTVKADRSGVEHKDVTPDARAAISSPETTVGIDYDAISGQITITTGFEMPTSSSLDDYDDAFAHSQLTTGNPHNVTANEIGADSIIDEINTNGTDTIDTTRLDENVFDVSVDDLDDIGGGTTNVHLTTTLKSAYDEAVNDSHTHSNKANLDEINQDLATTDDVAFNSLSTGKMSGGLYRKSVTVTAATYTVADNVGMVKANPVSNNITITLPDPTSRLDQDVIIECTHPSNIVTIVVPAGKYIRYNGTTYTQCTLTTYYEFINVIAINTATWMVIAQYNGVFS